jgi:GDSL-like Lipase/Acylhydrolase family
VTTRRTLLKAGLAAGAVLTTGRPAAAQAGAPTLARLGDSIAQFAEFAQPSGPPKVNRRTRGAMTWVKTLYPAFNDDVWHYPADTRGGRNMRGSNHGLAGDHTEFLSTANPGTLLRWTEEVAPMAPAVTLLSVGTNNLNSSQPAAQVQADLTTHIDTILDAGGSLILTTIRPRAGTGAFGWDNPSYLTDPRYDRRRAVNDWIRAQPRPGLVIADVNTRLEDPASRGGAGGDWLPAVAPPDGVHPASRAAWAEALTLLPAVRRFVPEANVYGTNPAAPGNLLPGGAFTGTGGSLGPGITGQCATGWSFLRTAGDGTAVASKVSDAGGERQGLTIAPGAQATTFVFQTAPAGLPLAGVPAGTWLRFHLDQQVSAYPGWLSYNPRLFLRDAANTYTFQASALEPLTGDLLPDASWRGWPATHPVQTTAQDATAWCSVLVSVAGGVPGPTSITFGAAQLRAVPDPRTAWNV